MNFDIEELKIVFYTNLSKKNKNIVFTKSLLYNPEQENKMMDDWNEYPYFTFDVVYPMDKLIYYSFKDRMDFFFNKQKFNEILLIYSQNDESLRNIKKDENYFKKKDLFIEKNIMIMLELLFPTKFPAIKNLKQSFHIVFGKTSIMNHLYNPFNNDFLKFSYLKIDGKIYTFKSLIWLNDILNHPIYRDLIVKYRKYMIWYEEETNKNFEIINKSMNELFVVSKNILLIVSEIINDISLSSNEVSENMKLMDFVLNFYELYFITFQIVKHSKKNEKNEKINIVLNHEGLNNNLQTKISNIEENINDLIKENTENKLFLTNHAIQIIQKIKNEKMNTDPKQLFMNEKMGNNKNIINKYIEMMKNYKLFLKNSVNKQFINLNLLFDLNNKTYNEILSEYQENKLIIPIEYKNFAYYTINQFKRPIRESSNIFLQNLINMTDNLSVKDFHSFMNKIIQYFILNKQENKLLKNEKKLLKTDLNYINTNVNIGLKREIYVMVDFIEGEVNDDVVNKINCSYIDQRLGEFDNLFRKFYYKSYHNYWDVDKNRILFSMDNFFKDLNPDQNKIAEQPIKQETENKPTNRYNDVNINYEKNKMYTMFNEKILQKNEVKNAMKELNDINVREEINEYDLIHYIHNNNKLLYNYIEKWSEKEYDLSEDLLNNLIRLSNDYKSMIQILMNEEKSYNQENYEIKYKIKLNELYATITDALIENENKKNRALKIIGGNKKTKKNDLKMNKTKKNVR